MLVNAMYAVVRIICISEFINKLGLFVPVLLCSDFIFVVLLAS